MLVDLPLPTSIALARAHERTHATRTRHTPHASQRMHLRIDIGEQAVDYAEVAKTEHLSAIEVEVRKLIDKLNQVRHETQYQRDREEEFRNTSESTNSRIMWFSLGETLVLVLSGLYQVVHLKSFFKGKKLV